MTDLSEAAALVQQAEATVVLDGHALEQAAQLDAAYIALFPDGQPVVIKSDAQNAEAQVLQASLNDLLKEIEAKKKEASEPYRHALMRIGNACKPYIERIDDRLSKLVPAMREWYIKQQMIAREAQEKANREAEKQRQREAAKAEKKGVEPPPPTPARVIEQPAKSTDLGGVRQTFTDHHVCHLDGLTDEAAKKLRRSDPQAKGIPDSLFVLDWGALQAQAKASKGLTPEPFPGSAVRYVNEPIPVNRKQS